VVRHGDFVGVVAPNEYDAIQAAAQLKVTWAEPPVLPGVGNLFDQMREQDAKGLAAAAFAVNTGNFDAAYAAAPIKLSQSYRYHYNGSMAMGPECCVAVVTPAGARAVHALGLARLGQLRPAAAGRPARCGRRQRHARRSRVHGVRVPVLRDRPDGAAGRR
jgi:hypothetical protein